MFGPSEPFFNPTRRDPPREGTIVGEYRLCRQIGSGGLSWVYMAERLRGGPLVAIKFLRGALANLPGFVRRFEREAQICRRLDHPRCVRLFDFGIARGVPFLVMELIDGISVAELLRSGALPPKRAIAIVRQVCSALGHAHERSVIHRDLKPGNIMITADDRVKVVDFGTSVLCTSGGTCGELDMPSSSRPGRSALRGTDIGSPSYMAPELVSGQPAEPRTDLYALGVILFELLTGQRPYVATNAMRVLQMQLSAPIPSARALLPEAELSPELEGVIVRAMQKAPERRFVDAWAFSAALDLAPETRRACRPPLGAARLSPPSEASPARGPVGRESQTDTSPTLVPVSTY